jgi:thiamine biosynthesis lipoprotein
MNMRWHMAEELVSMRRARPWLGTLVEIYAEAPRQRDLDGGIVAAFACIERIHRALTAHDPESELSRVNRGAVSRVQAISSDLRSVLVCALEIAAQSRGAFDPAIGGRSAAFGFLPPQDNVDDRAQWLDIELTRRGVRFMRALRLDFGGIAKGYAVDCAIAALREHGATRGRVNAGGDLRVFGRSAEAIHVRTGGPQGIVLPLVSIADGAVATSAYGGRRHRLGRRWATPLIDPISGLAVMSTRTVSVVASSCMVADALTKVVALRGRLASSVLATHDAAAVILSPAAGRWRCTRLPQRAARAPLRTGDVAHA